MHTKVKEMKRTWPETKYQWIHRRRAGGGNYPPIRGLWPLVWSNPNESGPLPKYWGGIEL